MKESVEYYMYRIQSIIDATLTSSSSQGVVQTIISSIINILHGAYEKIQQIYFDNILYGQLKRACNKMNQEDYRAWVLMLHIVMFVSTMDHSKMISSLQV